MQNERVFTYESLAYIFADCYQNGSAEFANWLKTYDYANMTDEEIYSSLPAAVQQYCVENNMALSFKTRGM